MAVDFRDRDQESLFSSKLLGDDHIVLSENPISLIPNGSSPRYIIPNWFGSSPASYSSGLSSPFGSELGSTETESDEEDDDEFIAELSRQMADYMLEEEDESAKDQPQEVHFYKVENQPSVEHRGNASWGSQAKRAELTHQIEQQKHLQRKKRNHQKQSKGGRADAMSCGGGGGVVLPAAWPPLLQQRGSGSGMRAVFLGGPASKSGSLGTGVFLPRAAGNPSDIRKKAGCSTVLIPARVIETLQLHFQEMSARSLSQSPSTTFAGLQNDAGTAREGDVDSQQKQGLETRASGPDDAVPQETGLPQEWTY